MRRPPAASRRTTRGLPCGGVRFDSGDGLVCVCVLLGSNRMVRRCRSAVCVVAHRGTVPRGPHLPPCHICLFAFDRPGGCVIREERSWSRLGGGFVPLRPHAGPSLGPSLGCWPSRGASALATATALYAEWLLPACWPARRLPRPATTPHHAPHTSTPSRHTMYRHAAERAGSGYIGSGYIGIVDARHKIKKQTSTDLNDSTSILGGLEYDL